VVSGSGSVTCVCALDHGVVWVGDDAGGIQVPPPLLSRAGLGLVLQGTTA
jgi:hypothetical protein